MNLVLVKGVQRSGSTMYSRHYIAQGYTYEHTSVKTEYNFDKNLNYIIQDHTVNFVPISENHTVTALLTKRKIKSNQIMSWFVVDFLRNKLDNIQDVYNYQKEDKLPCFELNLNEVKNRSNKLLDLEYQMEQTLIDNNITYSIEYYEEFCKNNLQGQSEPTKARPENLITNYKEALECCKRELNEVL